MNISESFALHALLLLQLLGGLGLFAFALSRLGASLKKLFGENLQRSLETTAGNIFKAILAGALMAALTQSSSATMVLVIGFAAAGILPLGQCLGLIMGANIGTTITAQITALGFSAGFSYHSYISYLLTTGSIAYLLMALGGLPLLFVKKRKIRTGCQAILCIGLLLMGMTLMENAFTNSLLLIEWNSLMAPLQNPFLALVCGLLITLLIRSSTLSVALLQAMAVTGSLSMTAAIALILGINIGTCFSSFRAARGSGANARQAALLHLYFNCIGAAFALGLLMGMQGMNWLGMVASKAVIAHIHTLFNLLSVLLVLPFRSLLVRLAERTFRAEEAEPLSEEDRLLALLDPRFAATPAIALEQCRKVIRAMGQRAFANVRMATTGIVDHSQLDHEIFMSNEAFLDTCEARINTYLLTLKDASLSESCQRAYTEIQHTVGEFEQIGDYAENLHERYDNIREQNIQFSADAVCEIGIMSNALEEMSTLTLESFENSDGTLSDCIGALEEVIDVLKETLKDKHIQRLQQGLCTVQNGIPFLDIIHDLEKIADHCSNISIYVLMYDDGVTSFDIHEYHRMADEAIENHSQQWQEHYEERYLRPVLGERAE